MTLLDKELQAITLSHEEVFRHFAAKLALETDCSDVEEALRSGSADFVVLDVRGPNAFTRGHVGGAVNLPHRQISEETLSRWPENTCFVVYCAGPHCNGGDKAAMKIAALRRTVKLMIGGVTGWLDEGFDLVSGQS